MKQVEPNIELQRLKFALVSRECRLDAAKLYLFSPLKRIVRQWLDNHLVCKADTYPAQLMYKELAEIASLRITHAIMQAPLESIAPDQSTT